MLTSESILAQADSLLEKVVAVRTVAKNWDLSDLGDPVLLELRVQLVAMIDRIAPRGSAYAEAAEGASRRSPEARGVLELEGILRGLRQDVAAGYLASVEELIHADLFADFLEMASELLEKNYKDAAAVITGSVLEEHLRKLAVKNTLPTDADGKPKKADTLNADVEKAGVYNKLELKQVTAWLDLRNKAAHGQYDQYTPAQVQLMLEGVRDFLVRHTA